MLEINMSDEIIEQMVKEQVDASVRKRIKEMQGDYTSKGFIEKIIQDVIWDKILKLCPDVEEFIKDEVKRCVDYTFTDTPKMSKKELVEHVVDMLLEKFNYN